jgi:hypothetical protein
VLAGHISDISLVIGVGEKNSKKKLQDVSAVINLEFEF